MNKKIKHSIFIILTSITVAFTVVLPNMLIQKREKSLLGNSYIVDNGQQLSSTGMASDSKNLANPRITSSNRTAETDSEMTERVKLFKKASVNSTLSREISNESMSMREAVNLCINQVSTILSQNTTLTLNGFPNEYSVSGELRTIGANSGENGKNELQYWNIDFTVKPDKALTKQEISISMDAKFGIILAMSITFGNKIEDADLEKVLQSIAEIMNLRGGVLSLESSGQVSQTAIWGGKDSGMIIQLSLGQGREFDFIKMNLDTKAEVSSVAPPLKSK